MNEIYSWTSRNGALPMSATLRANGIEFVSPDERRVEPYDTITHVQLMPAAGSEGVGIIIQYPRKLYGMYVSDIIYGPRPPVVTAEADAFNRWVLALHRRLIELGLSNKIEFKCGAAMNTWGLLFYVTPAIRTLALILAPLGLVGAVITGNFTFALTCVGGAVVLLTTPKVKRPVLPKRLRRIGPYDPAAIPDECLATATPVNAG